MKFFKVFIRCYMILGKSYLEWLKPYQSQPKQDGIVEIDSLVLEGIGWFEATWSIEEIEKQ